MTRCVYYLICFLFPFASASAETIIGDIIDASDKSALQGVNIYNIHTSNGLYSDSLGRFSISASKGDLIEFRKIGYKTLRVRIPMGNIPPYFKIMMQKGPVELPEFLLRDKNRDYRKDSLEYRAIYRNALEFEELTGLDALRHPFSALSKKNRRIWAFQKEYNWFEREKYIDYTFTDKLIGNLTGLSGDSLQNYKRIYRPSYDLLRSLNEYSFYSYIKETAELYRTGRRYRPSPRRSAN